MRTLVFTKRNIKECLKDPLSLIFCFVFPIVLFIIFRLIVASVGAGAVNNVPQFAVANLTPTITIFSFSFLTLFCGMTIAKDRSTAFLTRLKISPMKNYEFILGYFIPFFIISILQVVICYTLGIILGLPFSGGIFLSMLLLLPASILFIMLGLLLGVCFSDKAVGGISSLVINISVLLSGMFMPLDAMSGPIVVISKIFPFAPCVNLSRMGISGNFANFGLNFAVAMIYVVALAVISLFVFTKKQKQN